MYGSTIVRLLTKNNQKSELFICIASSQARQHCNAKLKQSFFLGKGSKDVFCASF